MTISAEEESGDIFRVRVVFIYTVHGQKGHTVQLTCLSLVSAAAPSLACCLETPFALTGLSPRGSLLPSSKLDHFARHLALGCCHLASQEQACPSVDTHKDSS